MPSPGFSTAARKAAGHRFGIVVPIVVAVLGLAAIAVGQNSPNRHGMEHNLTDRSNSALRSAGLGSVQVSFTGRDAVLHADTQTDADRALAIVRGLDGVRVARAVVPPVVTPSATPVTTPPTLTIAVAGGKVTISGSAPTAAASAALTDAAASVFGAGKVQNTVTVDPTVTDSGLSGLTAVLSALGKDTTDATAKLSGGTLTLTGTVSAQATKDAVHAAGLTVVGDAAHLVDQLNVVAVAQQLVQIPPVTFLVGSATLDAAGLAAVQQAFNILTANPTVKVSIEGHTDSNGTAASNLVLSQARALTVLNTLVSMGINPARMTSTGFGETRPRVPDTTPANQALNRRVEFIIIQ